MYSYKNFFIVISILFFFITSNNTYAGLADLGKTEKPDKIIPVDQAFQFTVENNPTKNSIEILAKAASDTYLYKKNFKFKLNTNNINLLSPEYPKGNFKHDEIFGEVEVFENDFKIIIPYKINEEGFKNPISFTFNYQGCLNKTYCYPPQEKTIDLNFSSNKNNNQNENSAFSLLEKASFWQIILGFFIFGIFLSFTPCVLPMIPILSSVIIGKCKINNKHVVHHNAFLLSLTYVISMSLVYAMAGILVASAGQNLQAYLQSPFIIIIITILFVVLAISMFGFYEITIPHFIEDRIGTIYRKQQGGSYIGAAIMGVIATLIVSPCTSAPLAGALLYIATTGDITLGAFALFFLSFGMGLPLLIIGLSSKKLLPKAGKWMDSFKNLFGVILLGMAIYILGRIIPGYITLGLWGVLFISYAVILGLLEPAPELKDRLKKAIGLILAIFGIIYLVGAANYNTSAFEPLKNFSLNTSESSKKNFTSNLNWIKADNIKSYNNALEKFHSNKSDFKYAMVDFTADWCSICQHIERTVFANPDINKKLQKLFLIKVDVTDYNDQNKALMQHLKVFNPPTILFFDKDKRELNNLRITGEITPNEFNNYLSHLK